MTPNKLVERLQLQDNKSRAGGIHKVIVVKAMLGSGIAAGHYFFQNQFRTWLRPISRGMEGHDSEESKGKNFPKEFVRVSFMGFTDESAFP